MKRSAMFYTIPFGNKFRYELMIAKKRTVLIQGTYLNSPQHRLHI